MTQKEQGIIQNKLAKLEYITNLENFFQKLGIGAGILVGVCFLLTVMFFTHRMLCSSGMLTP